MRYLVYERAKRYDKRCHPATSTRRGMTAKSFVASFLTWGGGAVRGAGAIAITWFLAGDAATERR